METKQIRVMAAEIYWARSDGQDRALSADLAELSLRYCKRGELTMFPVATHWLQHEEQESVSRALAEFFLPAPEGQGLRDKA
jgi:pimeloyl-ACP methyl ester carboxylesterase